MPEPAASQIIAGKYRLESLIGHGGMGSVWRARHATLDMPVAVKFMAPQALADAESRQRFDREARALAALRTPHIVQVLDHGVDDDTPYIVMEYLEGEDLSERLAKRRRLPLDEVSHILSHVARALRRAHEAGITHRDLKPSNIYLARIDDEEVVKVLDFGVAKLAQAGVLDDDGLTKAGTLLGSPGYMSPEQARGKEVDFRSDLWALAVIVFRCVTGVKPFAGDSIAELVIKLCIDPRPIPTRLAPDLPPAADRFFEKAFAATPEERFQSAVEMANAFAAMMGLGPPASLEVSRSGPSPVAALSRSWLDGPPPAAGATGAGGVGAAGASGGPGARPGSSGVQVPVPLPPATPPSGRAQMARAPSYGLSPSFAGVPAAGVAVPGPEPAAPPASVAAAPEAPAPVPPRAPGKLPEPRVPGRVVAPGPAAPRSAGRMPQEGTAVMPLPAPTPAPAPSAPPPPAPPPPSPSGAAAPSPSLAGAAPSPSLSGAAVLPAPGGEVPPAKGSPPALPFPLPPVPPPAMPKPGQTTLLMPPPAGREPTPTPASFAGFAPSGAEASVPPAASPTATPLPDGALRPPPTGVPGAQASGAPPAAPAEAQGPPGMRLQSPTLPRIAPPPRTPGRPQLDVKVLLFAAAGAAILAIFFSLAIAGLRRRHAAATRSMDDDVTEPAPSPAPTEPAGPTADPTDAPTAAPTDAPTADPSAGADPARAPGAEPSAEPSADPSAEPSADPSASASAAPSPPKPTYVAPRPTIVPPRPKPGGIKPKPKPTSTTKSYPAPTATTKKRSGTR